MRVQQFLALSRRLTGVSRLAESVAVTFLEALSPDDAATLDALLARAAECRSEDTLAAALADPNDPIAALARAIIVFWYLGRIGHPPTITADAYAGSRLYDVVGAHLPGVTGGYFGYWRYPPES